MVDGFNILDIVKIRAYGNDTNYGTIWSGRRDSNPRLQPWQGCVHASEIV